MEGSYYYSDGEEHQYAFNDYETSGYYNDPESNVVWSDPDHYEGGINGSSPPQPVWGCCAEASSSPDEAQSQPDCPCQHASTSGSDDASLHSASDDSRTESEWETDYGTSSVASATLGKSCACSTDATDSCRNSQESDSSEWETASTEESASSWETATTCSCEAAELFAACQSCRPAEPLRWDQAPPENPNYSPADEWMSHPFSEGGGGSGSLVPLPPSVHLPRAPPQRRQSPYYRRWKKLTSSGVGQRPETMKKQAEQKQARRPCTIPKAISAPAANPIAAQKSDPARCRPAQAKPRRRRFRWNTVQKRLRKATATDAVKIGDGVAGPSGKNQRRLRTASCPKAVPYQSQ